MGPALNLFVPVPFTVTEALALHRWIGVLSRGRFTRRRLRQPSDAPWDRGPSWTFWVPDGGALRMPGGVATPCALWLSVLDPGMELGMERGATGAMTGAMTGASPDARAATELGPEDDLRATVVEALGQVPPTLINVFAGCNDPLDHLTLGYVALRLLEIYGGVIDVDAALTPAHVPGAAGRILDGRAPTAEEVTAIRAFVRHLPGNTYEIVESDAWASQLSYVPPFPTRLPRHLIDATCLRAWLAQPNFHFIK